MNVALCRVANNANDVKSFSSDDGAAAIELRRVVVGDNRRLFQH